MTDFNPSRCTVEKAILKPYNKPNASQDITLMIGGLSIRQSIDAVAMGGEIQVLDSVGLLESLPLRGEEELELEIKAHDIDTVRKIVAQVYKISNVESSIDTKKNTYTLHWVTKTSFDAGIRRHIAAYTKLPASSIIKDIFQKYYSTITPSGTTRTDPEQLPDKTTKYNVKVDNERYLYMQQTEDPMQLTIPDYTPSEAIHFVSKRAHMNGETKSSSFRFFENWNGYYFVTDEWLFKRGTINTVNEFVYSPFTGKDALDADEQVRSLLTFVNPRRADVAEELSGGAYKNTVLEIDLLRHQVKRYNYSYLSNDRYSFNTATGKKASYKADVHTKEFSDDIFTPENAKRFTVIRDYRTSFDGKSFRDDMNFREIAAKRVMFKHHMRATQVEASTRGRLDIQAGDVIKVKTKELNVSRQDEINNQLSGRYLVTQVINTISEGVLTTAMSLFKYGWSDGGIDPEGEV